MTLALGVLALSAFSVQAQEAAPVSTNQATADAVAGAIRASKSLSRYRIEIESQDGLVTLSGKVANSSQKAEALTRARSVAGVTGIIDNINVGADRRVRRVQYQYQTAFGGHHGGGSMGGDVVYDGAPMTTAAPAAAAMPAGPMPEGPAGSAGATQAAVPGGPNYAWPGGAAAGYPTNNPWAAQANVMPAYPNPEIPLGWRRVTLRWDDGLWWLDFKKNYYRPFATPYPFQIWAY
jgi:hypothetical protein